MGGPDKLEIHNIGEGNHVGEDDDQEEKDAYDPKKALNGVVHIFF